MVICPCLGGEAMILRQFDQIKCLVYDLCVHILTYYIFAPDLRVINPRGEIAVVMRVSSPMDVKVYPVFVARCRCVDAHVDVAHRAAATQYNTGLFVADIAVLIEYHHEQSAPYIAHCARCNLMAGHAHDAVH